MREARHDSTPHVVLHTAEKLKVDMARLTFTLLRCAMLRMRRRADI